ncbi:LuxR C-terminal-related transcriptional regulator [Nocardioides sp.]|uniref:LuxR C-terminal-related transcriptional regulator n=1 Tax=Nocardioides sp. TaxID=35761 RepID=UPI0032196016
MTTTTHAAHSRSGPSCTLIRDSLSDAELADLEAVIESAETLLGPRSLPPLDSITDFQVATSALHSGWETVRTALREGGKVAERVSCSSSLDDLLTRMQSTERVVRAAEVRSRDRAVRVASETLASLQDMTSVKQLVDAGAEAVCRLGFDRAIVSSVKESMWLTESLYVDGDSEWASEILDAGRQAPQHLESGLPEQDLVRRRRPIVVTRVQKREQAKVHHAVAEASQSRSYVAAPIMPRSRVIGFLHGDRFFHRGDVTQFDSDLLGLFAQGYGFALERAILTQELADLRAQVQGFAQGLEAMTREGDSDRGAAAWGAPGTPPAPQFAAAAPGSVLHMQFDGEGDTRITRREQEVLKLMACGDTNMRIANKLIISEGTVKSHVKHILRKLGAANRAEAVALWHSGKHVS